MLIIWEVSCLLYCPVTLCSKLFDELILTGCKCIFSGHFFCPLSIRQKEENIILDVKPTCMWSADHYVMWDIRTVVLLSHNCAVAKQRSRRYVLTTIQMRWPLVDNCPVVITQGVHHWRSLLGQLEKLAFRWAPRSRPPAGVPLSRHFSWFIASSPDGSPWCRTTSCVRNHSGSCCSACFPLWG